MLDKLLNVILLNFDVSSVTGGVKSERIPKDKNGQGKGFAYIEFKDRISHGVSSLCHCSFCLSFFM